MPFFVKRNGQAVPIVSEPNVINDTTASQNTAYSGNKVDSLIANKIDALTPKVYSLFIAKTDWDETGTVEIDVPGTFGYDIPSENYNQLVLSDEQTDHWRRFNVCLDHAHDASGYITTIEFSCDPGNIPDRPIYFNIVSSKSEYVDWSVIGNLIVPPGLQVDTLFDSDSTNPVQNKVIKSALDGKATPADIAALIDDTTAAQNKAYSSAKVEEKVAGEEITTTATGSDLTLSTSSGNLNALTVYGKSEVVDGAIVSAGEGYAVVDLGALTWTKGNATNGYFYSSVSGIKQVLQAGVLPNWICSKYNITTSRTNQHWETATENKVIGARQTTEYICIVDNDYATADATAFKNSLNGVILAYQLADPTQGNCIAIKTDSGSGIDGTMATFTTGTPLYGVSADIRDVMEWDGSAGTVTKMCGIMYPAQGNIMYWSPNDVFVLTSSDFKPMSPMMCSKFQYKYAGSSWTTLSEGEFGNSYSNQIGFKYAQAQGDIDVFKAYINNMPLVYELATPTTEQLTSTENASIAELRTFEPQTHAQNNAQTDMTVEAYAGTANGKAVQELKQDVQSEISELKITQSGVLSLTVNSWSNNAQTVTYAHDTAKRNVIDVDPTSVEEWASCGVLATAETATSITFSCKTVPTNALTFRVTSMGVN